MNVASFPIALALLVYGCFRHLPALAVPFAGAALAGLGARLVTTFRENARMLAASQEEALHDALTGLGNRRALARAVEDALDRSPDDGRPWVLALFDLDGFKGYNDAYGHPAGDALLVRLGASLSDVLPADGHAFRMGGDEFCALLRCERGTAASVVSRAAAALSDHGEGFAITCSYGVVLLPEEAGTTPEALRIADQRMYAHKRSGRASAGRQSKDVLLQALAERNPDLQTHLHDVAALAEATALHLGLEHDEVETIRHAAELHDVGKVAVPDAILNKPSALDDAEWGFIRQHTIVGERGTARAREPRALGRRRIPRRHRR